MHPLQIVGRTAEFEIKLLPKSVEIVQENDLKCRLTPVNNLLNDL